MELNSMWWGLFPAAIFQGKNFGKIIMRPSTPHFFHVLLPLSFCLLRSVTRVLEFSKLLYSQVSIKQAGYIKQAGGNIFEK